MNQGIFTYSLLRYIHSQVLGEVINVGILFIFPDQQRVIFKSPARLHRLKELYKCFSEHHVRQYLRSFEHKARQINKQWDLFAEHLIKHTPDKFTSVQFIASDDTALQFDEARKGVLYTVDIEQIADALYQSFFSQFQSNLPVKPRHDEEYLLKQYKHLLHKKNQEIEQYLKPGITIETESTSLKADLVWQNGTTNLVKSVGLDLVDAENINRKSLEYFARLNFLSELAAKQHTGLICLYLNHKIEHYSKHIIKLSTFYTVAWLLK
jgi:hypothetical protein